MLGIKILSPIIVNDRTLDEPYYEKDQVRMIKKWHTQSLKDLIDAVIESREKANKNMDTVFYDEDGYTRANAKGYNQALDDTIKELKAIREML